MTDSVAARRLLALALALRRGWDRVSAYLPLALMALLALVTYLLARQTPGLVGPQAPAAPRSEPDYFLRGFSIKNFDEQGRLKSEVFGQAGRHFPDRDVLEIDQPRVRSFNARGEPTVATAQRALSNGDGTQVQLIGNAVVVREPPSGAGGALRPRLEIRGELLHVFVETERVRADRPVEIRRGNDRYTADRMDFDNLDQQLQLQGRVRGQIAPRRP